MAPPRLFRDLAANAGWAVRRALALVSLPAGEASG